MKITMKSAFTMALLGGVFALGCSSSSNSDDGGGLGGAGGSESDGGGDTGPTLYGLSTGLSCFDVVSIATGFNDGCMIGVGDPASTGGPVGAALPVTYTMATATLTVGTQGSLGTGTIAFNMGTLNRAGNTSDSQMPTCTWHQTDTSNVTLTATNEFDIAVTEVENMFATACGTTAPTGGTCTSTWTWHMKKSTTKTPAVDASGNPCQ
jgi:hypothetical protein